MEVHVLSLFLVLQGSNGTGSPASATTAWLAFLSTLIWQAVIVYILLAYGTILRELLQRISKLKVIGVESEFQPQSADAKVLAAHTAVQIKSIGEDGFLTADGVKQLISSSGLLQSDEEVRKALLLFRTARQRTWLVSTDKSLFCVLDDSRTRKKGTLIQWRESISAIRHISANEDEGSPVVNIGNREGWLYSNTLHPDPDALVADLRAMIEN